ncbi:MAG: hypothetical protein U0228_28605 [Myxococcaceae bacterium]
MVVEKTPDELKAAVDSMFRIRAVESPPDAQGLRKVWHRGARYAELVSEIDSGGRVARHEFTLYDDVLIWERGKGFVTGKTDETSSARGAANVAFDLTTEPLRLERMTTALKPYSGRDRIIHHLRELVLSVKAGEQPLQDLGVVTGSNPTLAAAAMRPLMSASGGPPPEGAVRQRNRGLVLMGIGLMVIAVALAFLALK